MKNIRLEYQKIQEKLARINAKRNLIYDKLRALRKKCPHERSLQWKEDWHCNDCGLDKKPS